MAYTVLTFEVNLKEKKLENITVHIEDIDKNCEVLKFCSKGLIREFV